MGKETKLMRKRPHHHASFESMLDNDLVMDMGLQLTVLYN
jgi:hypothetical protein